MKCSRMRQRDVISCVVIIGSASLLSAASTAAAQPSSQYLGNPLAWEVLFEGPEFQISGLVLTKTGTPLGRALVSVDGVGTLGATDSSGRFTVTVPDAGEWIVRISSLGSLPFEQVFVMPSGSNIQMVVMLEDRASACGVRACGGPGGCEDLEVRVFDATTGRPPPVEVTLRVEHASGSREATYRYSGSDPDAGPYLSLGLGGRLATAGFHNLEVTAPGYAPWRRERVWLEVTRGCDPILVGRLHEVRLEPL